MGEEKSFSQRAFSICTDIRKLQDKAKTSYTWMKRLEYNVRALIKVLRRRTGEKDRQRVYPFCREKDDQDRRKKLSENNAENDKNRRAYC